MKRTLELVYFVSFVSFVMFIILFAATPHKNITTSLSSVPGNSKITSRAILFAVEKLALKTVQ